LAEDLISSQYLLKISYTMHLFQKREERCTFVYYDVKYEESPRIYIPRPWSNFWNHSRSPIKWTWSSNMTVETFEEATLSWIITMNWEQWYKWSGWISDLHHKSEDIRYIDHLTYILFHITLLFTVRLLIHSDTSTWKWEEI
jgi:hypothetical protein